MMVIGGLIGGIEDYKKIKVEEMKEEDFKKINV